VPGHGTARWVVLWLGRAPGTLGWHGHGPISPKARLAFSESHSLASPVVSRPSSLILQFGGDRAILGAICRFVSTAASLFHSVAASPPGSSLRPPVGSSTAPSTSGLWLPLTWWLLAWLFGHGFGYAVTVSFWCSSSSSSSRRLRRVRDFLIRCLFL
jgi:hypothetical protein